MGKTERGKGTKLMALADASGLPLAVYAASCAGEDPERLIGDRAYDSDSLDEALEERGIEMLAPHRRHRKRRFSIYDMASAQTYNKANHPENATARDSITNGKSAPRLWIW